MAEGSEAIVASVDDGDMGARRIVALCRKICGNGEGLHLGLVEL